MIGLERGVGAGTSRSGGRGFRAAALLTCGGLALLGAAVRLEAAALPENPSVVSGKAVFEQTPTSLTIRQATPQAIINWHSFSIAPNHLAEFVQPSSSAIALNRVVGGVDGVIARSVIEGTLKANGIVMILNQNGVLFAPGSQVNVGGLAASSLHMADTDFLAGSYKLTQFIKDGVVQSVGDIRNAGTITAAQGVYLFSPTSAENSGIITNPNGSIVLAAGTEAYLSNRPDGRGFLVELKAPAGQALNLGELRADGGQITMAGLVVNQQGLVQANTVQSNRGRIELIAKQPDGAAAGASLATVTLGAGSRTTADGGAVNVTGQRIDHQGDVQANGGAIDFTATAGTQAGAGALVLGAGGKATANGGRLTLSGDTIAHAGTVQADRLNGVGGAVDVRARGTAGSVTTAAGSRIQANGGDVAIEGKTIDHAGLVQADAAGDRNGHVTFFGGDRLTFRSTSRTSSKGGTEAPDGGTIIGMAANEGGAVAVETGATLDLSPASGGVGGDLWLGDRRQSPALIGTGTVLGATQTRLIPVDQQVFALTGIGGQRDVSLVALNDLTVTGLYDLAGLAPGAASASLRFIAGRDVKFTNATVQHDQLNLGATGRRHLHAVAGNSVLFSDATVVIGGGGHASVTARRGSVSLIDGVTGQLSSIRVKGGGDLRIDAQRDVVAGTNVAADQSELVRQFLGDSNVQGIVIDGTRKTAADGSRSGSGTLTIQTREGDLVGGAVLGSPKGPGFVVRNADAEVTVGGKIGTTNLALDADGLLPDGLTMFRNNLTEDVRGYLDVAMTDARLSISAQGNVYLRRARDAGLLFEPLSGGDSAFPVDIGRAGFAGEIIEGGTITDGFQHNQLAVTSRRGNVVVNTTFISSENVGELRDAASFFPSVTTIQAVSGTIQLRNAMNFFNGPQASIKFLAGRHVDGLVRYGLVPPPTDQVFYVYAGIDNNPANWRVVDFRKPVPPELLQWVGVTPPSTAPPKPVSLPAEFLESAPFSVPIVRITEQSPDALIGLDPRQGNNINLLQQPASTQDPAGAPGRIEVATGQGDIRNLQLLMFDQTYRKEVAVKAGGNIERVALSATATPLGSESRIVTEKVPLVRDVQTGQLRAPRKDEVIKAEDVVIKDVAVTVNVPKPSVIVEAAGSIDLSKAVADREGVNPPPSGLRVRGDGTVQIKAGKNLNLGDSQGIFMNPGRTPTGTRRGGLLDIAVGQDLLMDQSRIVTDGGAGISIHGTDPSYIPGYDNLLLHPVEVPEAVRGTRNVSFTGGVIDVGKTVKRIEGQESTGIQARSGGSVGTRASAPVVNQDGSVTVTLEQDPAAIRITSGGDVNVNSSRIATFAGGDIVIQSLLGSINAGSGGKGEQQLFSLDLPVLDENGRPKLKPNGEPETRRENFLVPGSGIFTFHPLDPTTLNFPKFDTPAMTALKGEIAKQGFLGRDTTSLQLQFEALSKERLPEFERIFEEFILRNPDKVDPQTGKVPEDPAKRLPLELGDVALNAGLDILVPPAGIRGRRVDLVAGRTLDFQGGEVQGKVSFKAANLTGDIKVTGTFVGSSTGGGAVSVANSGGGGSVGGLSGVTGGVAATTASTSASVSTAQKATEAAQEAVSDAAAQQADAKAKKVASKDEGKGKSNTVAQSIKMKHGVIIQVDVKPKAGG